MNDARSGYDPEVPTIEISVIIASDRVGPDLDACLASLAAQEGAPPFEVLVVSALEPARRGDLLAGWIRMEERNPAMRRNRGADFAAGRLLAFIDDDARAARDWLSRAAFRAGDSPIFGGPDLLPPGSGYAERVSDLLLATPRIGSAIAAHERAPRGGPVRSPSDLALCNLFVERELFDRLGGFDESLGYIGEDTDFLRRAIERGVAPVLDPRLVVFHRRRPFPGPFLAQRWRYRVKTGRLLVEKPSGQPRKTVMAFLAGGVAVGLGALLFGRKFVAPAAAAYAAATWAMSSPIWRRDRALFPIVPAAFFLHHANYWLATVAGAVSALARRPGAARTSSPASSRPSPPAPAPATLPSHPQ